MDSVRGRPVELGRQLRAARGAEVRPSDGDLLTAGGAELPLSGRSGRRSGGGRAVARRWYSLTGDAVAGHDHSREERPVVVGWCVVAVATSPAARAPVKALVAAPRRANAGGGVSEASASGYPQVDRAQALTAAIGRRAVPSALALVVLPPVAELRPHGAEVLRRSDLSVATIAALLFLDHTPVVIVDDLPAGGL